MKQKIIGLIVLVVIAAGLYANRVLIKQMLDDLSKPPLPEAVGVEEIVESLPPLQAVEEVGETGGDATDSEPPVDPVPDQSHKEDQTVSSIPSSFNLAVPFTPQAPDANWDLPYQEACEEASVYMAHLFFEAEAEGLVDADRANKDLQIIFAYEDELFGTNLDTTAQQTAILAESLYGLSAQVVDDPSIEFIKREISLGHVVIVPAAGRLLGNPYFRAPGPLYHMLVIRGYTQTQFITNDPGTRRGEAYMYPFEKIMYAMHDWNGGDVENGDKVIIVLSKNETSL